MAVARRALLVPAVALAIAGGTGAMAHRSQQAPDPSSEITFEAVDLNGSKPGSATVREVAPALTHIRSWISAVGGAAALADLDGDGTADDVCLSDPRDDTVQVVPVGASTTPPLTLPAPPDHTTPTAPMGCVPVDLDENGVEDLLVYFWGRSPVLYLSDGDGGFRPHELVTPVQTWNTTAVNVADVDGDGHLDVLVGNYFPDDARILDPTAPDDGRLQMQDSMSLARNAGTNRLLLTRPAEGGGVPHVVDASAAFPAESATSWTLAWGAQDLTGDGLPELYVANDFGPDQLLVNHSEPGRPVLDAVVGRRTATTPKSQVLGRDSFKGMGVAFTHPDGAALPSIVVSNITSEYALQESNLFFDPSGPGSMLDDGRLPYVQSAERRGIARSGWSWDVKPSDLDNDGDEELYQATGFVVGDVSRWPELQELAMSNDTLLSSPRAWYHHGPGDDVSGREPNRLWTLGEGGRYTDVAASAGAADTTVARGIAVGDVDDDGRPDLVVANQWASSRLYLNRTPDAGESLRLTLRVPGANGGSRAAVGASVTVTSDGAEQHRQLYPANGHAGVSSGELHVGLGDGDHTPVAVTIRWRDGAGSHIAEQELSPGRHTLLLQDDGTVDPL